MFENIKLLRPYFHSLREIQNNVSLDIKLPTNWLFENVVKPYRTIQTKVQDKNDKFILLSIISQSTQEGYDIVFACANEIINTNKEEEEKQKLYQQKLKELQELFKKGSLDKLKEINLLENYGQEDSTSIGDIPEGSGERQDGDSEPQEEDD